MQVFGKNMILLILCLSAFSFPALGGVIAGCTGLPWLFFVALSSVACGYVNRLIHRNIITQRGEKNLNNDDSIISLLYGIIAGVFFIFGAIAAACMNA